jgi:hypothetical protein
MSREKDEIIRLLRLGDVRKLLRSRYGHTLPDDDAGREDLCELLLPISLGPQAALKMTKAIELWAPWLGSDEAKQLIDHINRTPISLRKPTSRQLGKRQQITNQQRERWKLWTIAPYDMTDEQLKEQRKAKKRARDRERRRKAGRKPRKVYLANNSISRTKPWQAEGKSRRTWYRRKSNGRGTGVRQLKLSTTERTPVPPEKLKRRKKAAVRARGLH